MSSEIFWLPEPSGRQLAIVTRPRPRSVEEATLAWKAAGLGVIVSLLGSEEAVALGLKDEAAACESTGIEFVSHPVKDFGVPRSVDDLSSLFETLTERMAVGAGVGIHCRGSVGRSGLVASCLLTYLGVEPQTAMRQISDARGYKVPELPEQAEWVLRFGAEAANKRSTAAQ